MSQDDEILARPGWIDSCSAVQMQLLDRFEHTRKGFIMYHQEMILEAVKRALGPFVKLAAAPISDVVKVNFVNVATASPTRRMTPGLHGTHQNNLKSIYSHGFMIAGRVPQESHEVFVPVANGRTFGEGIYVAAINSSLLAAGFCKGSPGHLIICAVLEDPAVRTVKDCMVISQPGLVVPMLEANGDMQLGTVAEPQAFRPLPEPILAVVLEEMDTCIDSIDDACYAEETRVHPAYGRLTLNELKLRIPADRVDVTWSRMR